HILITGATGGIGWETAKAAAQMGAKLTVTGRDVDKLQQLEKELKAMMDDSRLHVHAADLTDSHDRKRLVVTAEARLGFIGGLVNSAGAAGGKQVEELDQEFLEHLMNINYTSTF